MKPDVAALFKKVLRPSIFIIVGCVLGFIYYKLFACSTGCSITSNPYLTVLYGGVLSFLISVITKKEKSN